MALFYQDVKVANGIYNLIHKQYAFQHVYRLIYSQRSGDIPPPLTMRNLCYSLGIFEARHNGY